MASMDISSSCGGICGHPKLKEQHSVCELASLTHVDLDVQSLDFELQRFPLASRLSSFKSTNELPSEALWGVDFRLEVYSLRPSKPRRRQCTAFISAAVMPPPVALQWHPKSPRYCYRGLLPQNQYKNFLTKKPYIPLYGYLGIHGKLGQRYGLRTQPPKPQSGDPETLNPNPEPCEPQTIRPMNTSLVNPKPYISSDSRITKPLHPTL